MNFCLRWLSQRKKSFISDKANAEQTFTHLVNVKLNFVFDQSVRDEFYGMLSQLGNYLIADWVNVKQILVRHESTQKFLNVEYISRIEFIGPGDHKDWISSKNLKNISWLCIFKKRKFVSTKED